MWYDMIKTSTKKIKTKRNKQFTQGILAGMLLAIASFASATILSYGVTSISKFLSGIVFSMGLISIVLTSSQLFTGNVIGITSLVSKKVAIKEYFINLFIIYIANLIGALFICILIYNSGLLNQKLIEYFVNITNTKIGLSFVTAMTSGVLCNLLVCLAVILSMHAKDTITKIVVIIFPILIFIISGFEHCIANMFYLPITLMIKMIPCAVRDLNVINITISNIITRNFIPVTIGNILGGVIISFLIYISTKE